MRRRVLPRRRERGRESADGARLCSVVSCRVVSCRIVNKTVRKASRQAGRQADREGKQGKHNSRNKWDKRRRKAALLPKKVA